MIPLALVCIAIAAGSDRITARDLGLESPDPLAVVSPAPAPGVQRVFRVAELRRLAVRFQASNVPAEDICIERRTVPLDSAQLLDAMRRSMPEAQIEIHDFMRSRVPEGELEFPASGLRQTTSGAQWNGLITYAGGRRFRVWARVSVRAPSARVVAVEALRPGRVLDASQLRIETRDDIPDASAVTSIEEASGKILRRSVPAGATIQKQWLNAAPAVADVARGDAVRIEVHSGAALLALDGTAESSGSAGQTIGVINPTSKKRFRARVEGKGKVSVGEIP